MQTRIYTSADFDAVYGLWREEFAESWPISRDNFKKVISSEVYRQGDHLVMTDGGKVTGFCGGQTRNEVTSLVLLIVAKASRGKGFGKKLYAEWEKNVKSPEIKLASGGRSYFWPGLPEEIMPARKLFEEAGFDFYEMVMDMAADLSKFSYNPGKEEQLKREGFSFRFSTPADYAQIIKFEEENFDNWADNFKRQAKNNATFLLCFKDNKLIATSLFGELTATDNGPFWKDLFKGKIGEVGSFGVHGDYRRKGIATVMVNLMNKHLKELGFDYSFASWTWVPELYEKCGFYIWHKFNKAKKTLK